MTVIKEQELATPAPRSAATAAVSAAPPPPESRRVTVIEPRRGWIDLSLKEVWEYRDLLVTLAQRDIKLRYRQTALGAIWVVFQPLLASAIFTIIFGVIGKGKFSMNGLPPFLFIFAGQMGWQLFGNTVGKANTSLIANANLVSKVYFPRLVLPLSTVLSNVIDFAVSLVVLFVLMVLFRVAPTPAFLLMPLFVALTGMMAIGIGLFTAALTVSYRDVQYVVPVFLQLVMYASPVNYAVTSDMPRAVQLFYVANPLTGLVQGLRWSLFGVAPPSAGMLAYTVVVTVLMFIGGAYAFRNMERRFADVI
jgi:lipopolysaccharide transport system permease protein